jgi:hypothetical protein
MKTKMNIKTGGVKAGAIVATAAVLWLLAPSSFAASANPKAVTHAANVNNPAIMPIDSNPQGASYAEWSARFWQWEFSMPVSANPIFDTADCSAGQTGKTWFLGGSAVGFETSPGVITAREHRNCRVPQGTFLFVPIVNNECSTTPGDVLPISGGYSNPPTPGQLKACAQFASSFIVKTTLAAELDGEPIRALTQYHVTSPLSTYGPLPDNNVLQSFGLTAPAGTTAQFVNDGIQLMLHPLSTGAHELHFYSELDLGDIGGPKFVQDITYHLVVGH